MPFRRHPWEIARAQFFLRVLRESGLVATPRAVLDVGAGDGYLARRLVAELPPGSSVVCVDAHYSEADLHRFAQPPQAGLTFTRERPDRRFDVILLLDVIEHVENDRAFLADLVAANLKPDGVVLVSVPAWPALYGLADRALNHFRRYRPAACRALLSEAGLRVRDGGGLFHALLLLRAAMVAGERVRATLGTAREAPPDLGDWRYGHALTTLAAAGLNADNAISHALRRAGWGLPGLSFWALCGRAPGATPAAPDYIGSAP